MPELANRIRYLHYMVRVLEGQQDDALCGKCKALVNTVSRIEEGLAELESANASEIKTLPGDLRHLLAEARSRVAVIRRPENAVGQKRAGNCCMPEGVCFIKISKAVAEKI